MLLQLEKEGKPIKEIAGEMHLSSREVQRLILSIKSKLKAGNTDDNRN
jgi:DNA-binding NarL/FixJ family response regulator